jgi:hypothetical protein
MILNFWMKNLGKRKTEKTKIKGRMIRGRRRERRR